MILVTNLPYYLYIWMISLDSFLFCWGSWETLLSQVIEALSAEQLVEIVFTNPTVRVLPSYRDTGFTASYSFAPLANLIFTRDQQITTAKGVVMCRLRSEQRTNEVNSSAQPWPFFARNACFFNSSTVRNLVFFRDNRKILCTLLKLNDQHWQ